MCQARRKELFAHVCCSFMFTVQRAWKCQRVGAFLNICFSNNMMAETLLIITPNCFQWQFYSSCFFGLWAFWCMSVFKKIFFFLNTPLGTIGRAKPGGIRSLQQNRSSHYLCRATWTWSDFPGSFLLVFLLVFVLIEAFLTFLHSSGI